MCNILGPVLLLPLATAALGRAEDKPSTPADRYRDLRKEYNTAGLAFRKAETDLQRKEAVERFAAFSPRFLDLAEDNPTDPVAIPALTQAVQALGTTDSQAQVAWETNRTHFPAGSNDGSAARIVRVLLRDHARSDQLGKVCDRMRYGYRLEFEGCLDTLRRESPHREVRALACLGLARFLNDRLAMLELVADRPKLEERYDTLFGKEYLKELRRRGRAALAGRVEALLTEAKKYRDVKMPFGDPVGKQAEADLYALRTLAVGKPAPETAGKDQEGKTFRLRAYRGKVVLLYFWMEF